jgi:hypothetical protein
MEVYKTRATIWKDGRNIGHHSVDVIDDGQQLWAVLEWHNDTPGIKVALKRRFWGELNFADTTHLYQLPIHWPSDALGAG